MKFCIAGASGRMGRMLVEAVLASPGDALSGALDQAGSAAIDQDAAAFLGRDSGAVITAEGDAAAVGAAFDEEALELDLGGVRELEHQILPLAKCHDVAGIAGLTVHRLPHLYMLTLDDRENRLLTLGNVLRRAIAGKDLLEHAYRFPLSALRHAGSA